MPSSYTTSLRLTLPATGENSGTWGTLVNTGITELTDAAIAGYVSIAMTDADYTLTVANGLTDQARRMMLNMTGTLTAARNVICPTASKLYIIKNATTGGFAITLKTSAGTGISIPNGSSMLLMCNGTDVVNAVTNFSSLTLGTPLLPASGGTGITSLGTGVATWLGTPSSANLAAAVTDETGSGALVFGTSPTLASPTITGTGTAAFGNLSYTGTFTGGTGVVALGTNQFYKDASGNVGIGTASPAVKLDVSGQIYSTVADTVTAQRWIASTGRLRLRPYVDATSGATFESVNTAEGAYLPLSLFGSSVRLGNGAQVTIDSTGNVGVGTATPGAKLDVVGQIRASSVLTAGYVAGVDNTYIGPNGATGNGCVMATLNFAQNAYQPITYDASYYAWRPGGTEGMRLTSTGLGIGTASPSGKLVVSNAGANGFEFDPINGIMQTYNRSGSAYTGTKIYGSTFEVRTGASPVSSIFIDASNNVGIGTASPGYKLAVSSSGSTTVADFASTASGDAAFIGIKSSAGTYAYIGTVSGAMQFQTPGSGYSTKMTLDSSGNLGLGVTPSAWGGSNRSAMQFPGGNAVQGSGSLGLALFNNAYNNGTNDIYIANGAAYKQIIGTAFQWYTAPSGTAGNAISFTQAMTLDASGNLGIGTASPISKLEVQNGFITAGSVSGTNGAKILGGQYASGNLATWGSEYANGSPVMGYGVWPSTSASDAFVSSTTIPASRGAYTISGNIHKWYVGAAQTVAVDSAVTTSRVMTLDASGNLGLGQTPAVRKFEINAIPAAVSQLNGIRLQVAGVATSASELLLGTDGGGIPYTSLRTGNDGNGYMTFFTGAGPTERARITSGGDVGIGTTAPGSKLEVYGGAAGTVTNTQVGNASTAFLFGVDGSNNCQIRTAQSVPILFYTAATEKARITSGGDLLVGTTANTQTFRVVSESTGATNGIQHRDTAASGSTANAIQSRFTQAAGTTYSHFNGVAAGTEVFRVLGNGNVQNTNNSYGAISDLKLKENITDATPKLAGLMGVRVVNYNLIGDYEQHKQIGVIAQELEQIFPGMVEETPDRDTEGNVLGTVTKAVKYSVFVPMLIKSIQEQQALITSLTARVASLETQP